ncbi:MAG: hypothetical protein U9R14_00310 [Patescibacteria group bacterium]|nr:hypothetical protein [Patescibacteria group bacterium]
MQTQLQKAIDLVKKTGDRLLVFDSAKPDNVDNVYVVMNLKDYENLVLGKSEVRGLTEDELLDKINRDIAIWKSEQEFDGSGYSELAKNRQFDKFDFKNNEIDFESEEFSSAKATEDKDDKFNFEDINISNFENKKKKLGKVKAWSIPKGIKEGAEEVIEEDRQYLEDVVF